MRRILICIIACSIAIISNQAYAEKRQFIRFYKVNNQEQPTRLIMRRKTAEQAGCHNFRLKARVFQLNQVGYEYCSIYSAKDCSESSIISAVQTIKRDDKEEDKNKDKENESETAQTRLTEGVMWYPQLLNEPTHKRGIKLKSWYCKS